MVDSRSQDCFQFYKEKTKNCNAEIRDLKIAELDDHLSRLKQNLMHEARKLQNQMCKKIKDIVQNSSDQQLFLISDSIKNSSLKDEDLNYRLSRIIELGIE
jgi:ribosomal protein L29